jgi:hypothetical protein
MSRLKDSTHLKQLTPTNTESSMHVKQKILVKLSYKDQLKGVSPEAEY